MKKKNILVIFGGRNTEHEVSRKSAACIINNINKSKYNVMCLGITQLGEWIYTEASVNDIESGNWERHEGNQKAIISPDTTEKGIVIGEKTMEIDCVWPVLHGVNGEDGTIQGLCELANIKFVGSGVCASAICMDKAICKQIINNTEIGQALCKIVDEYSFRRSPNSVINRIEDEINDYPMFVKPAAAGSSVGITKVYKREDMENALERAFNECSKVLVEKAIVGRELEVAVLGNEEPIASCVGEVLSAGEWYDYDSKYNNTESKVVMPADINSIIEKEIQKSAIKIYKILGCSGMSRVDFFLDENSNVIFNEINTLPGFTNISMYPQLWECSGMTIEELVDKILSFAMDK